MWQGAVNEREGKGLKVDGEMRVISYRERDRDVPLSTSPPIGQSDYLACMNNTLSAASLTICLSADLYHSFSP